MRAKQNTVGIIRARRAVAETLASTLHSLPSRFTELELAKRWLRELSMRQEILPTGWYQPPPNGMSVLVANPPLYSRLVYKSLRDEANWPSNDIRSTEESVLYPYFSAIDRQTGMIGDFVATFYSGSDLHIREWISTAYNATRKIVGFSRVGMTFKELYDYAGNVVSSLGAINNTWSMGGGQAADIGHSVPWYADLPPDFLPAIGTMPQKDVATKIAGARVFVGKTSSDEITENCAFTIEPQIVTSGLPMASFHVIVIFDGGEMILVEEFADIFRHFGMDQWITAH